MKCPIDDTDLMMTDRQGVEIDYCPKCRGVWLDRGELDKVIERSQSFELTTPSREYKEEHRGEDRDYYRKPKKKRKESFLEDLFDF